MIECEVCGKYGHSQEINVCSGCMMDLCESCYGAHFAQCKNEGLLHFDEIENLKVNKRYYIKTC